MEKMVNGDAVGNPNNLKELLILEGGDFLLRNNGDHVPVSELQGKIVCLYFMNSSFRSCHLFTPILTDIYHTLKDRGKGFEIVSISLHDEEESFKNYSKNIPWLSLPFNDKNQERLRYVNLYGIEAYPFSADKLAELDEIDKKRLESMTLESLLVHEGLDFVDGKGGIKVPVSELNGKTVLFYFSKKECGPCQKFTPMLAKAYNEIKAKHDDLEVIYVCCDNDRKSFEDYTSSMPWLVIPYGDERERFVKNIFDFSGMPYVGVIGPSGGILTEGAGELVIFSGADAYPFVRHRIAEMKSKLEEMASGWPEKVKHSSHPHDLVRSRTGIIDTCDGCRELGHGWFFRCDECDYGLHPGCALKDNDIKAHDDQTVGQGDSHNQVSNGGWICD
ncbi:hypothetical protein IFM89_034420, partial [Coptis chinensis]